VSGQYSEKAALWAEKLYRSAYLITGDAACAEKLVLNTLLQGKSLWMAAENEHVFQIALYKRLVRGCLFTCAKYSGEQFSICPELGRFGKLRRTAIVLSCFAGFDETDVSQILGIPAILYTALLKKSIHKLTRLYAS